MLPLRQFPSEMHRRLFEEMNLRDLSKLRTTSKEMMGNQFLEEAQSKEFELQLDALKDQALYSYFKDHGYDGPSKEKIFILKEELEVFKVELYDEFVNKTKEQISDAIGQLAQNTIWEKLQGQHEKSDYCSLAVRRCMLAQATLLASARFDPSSNDMPLRSLLEQAYSETISDIHPQSHYDSMVGGDGWRVAALFSSRPMEMEPFVKELDERKKARIAESLKRIFDNF